MRARDDCRVAVDSMTVRHVLVSLGRPGRRCGAVLLTDDQGRLSGIFTDSDLARILERQQDAALDRPVREVMTQLAGLRCTRRTDCQKRWRFWSAARSANCRWWIAARCPIGLMDITDVIGLLPHDSLLTELDSEAGGRLGRIESPPVAR